MIYNVAEKKKLKNPERFWWRFDGTHYVAIVRDNPVAPDTVISVTSVTVKLIFFSFASAMVIWLHV